MPYLQYPYASARECFLIWLTSAKSLFKTQLYITNITDECIELEFAESHSNIRVNVNSYEITVSFYWNESLWDLLVCYEAFPELTVNGYVCALCDPNQLVRYSTINDLWEKHLLMPFLDWVNSKLVTAPYIEVYGSNKSVSSAKLVDSIPTKKLTRLPAGMTYQVIENPLFKGR